MYICVCMCVCVCVTESLCCTAEINTTLKINHASIEKRREERPDSFLLSAMWRHSKKVTICKPGRRFPSGIKFADTLTSDFLASRILRNKCLFKHPIYNILLDSSPIWLKQMATIISVLSSIGCGRWGKMRKLRSPQILVLGECVTHGPIHWASKPGRRNKLGMESVSHSVVSDSLWPHGL